MRNLINPEAIDEFIALSASPRRSLPIGLALRALRRPLRNEEALYSPVVVRPENAPPWITPEHIASGQLYAFDFARCDYDRMIDIQHVIRWLQRGHLRKEMSARERRKWETSLGHIRTLEEATRIATHQLTAWGERDLRAHRRERNAVVRRRTGKDPASFTEQIAQGQIVQRLRLPCGAQWYRLTTAEALTLEGREMGHCVGSGFYAAMLVDQVAAFFTLRNADLSPRLTVMVMAGGINEARRAGNAEPTAEDRDAIAHLLAAEGPLDVKAVNPMPGATRHYWEQRQRMSRASSGMAQAVFRLRQRINILRFEVGMPPRGSRWRIVDDRL